MYGLVDYASSESDSEEEKIKTRKNDPVEPRLQSVVEDDQSR